MATSRTRSRKSSAPPASTSKKSRSRPRRTTTAASNLDSQNSNSTKSTASKADSSTTNRARKRKHPLRDPGRRPTSSSKETTKPLDAAEHYYLALRPIVIPSPNQAAPASQPALDEPTLRLHLLAALSQYLGDHGAAVPIDILALRPAPSPSTHPAAADVELEPLLRVPCADAAAVMAALAGWTGHSGGGVAGYVVAARGNWLADVAGPRRDGGAVEGGRGPGLFDFAAGLDDRQAAEVGGGTGSASVAQAGQADEDVYMSEDGGDDDEGLDAGG